MEEQAVWWRQPLVVAALVVVALALAVLLFGPALRAAFAGSPAVENDIAAEVSIERLPTAPEAATEVEAGSDEVIIYITGAVARPDVYRLPSGGRVKDAVLAAGGLTEVAAAEAVNLAAPLADAQHIHIPAQGEAEAPAAATNAEASSGGKLNLNRATAAELEALPGIGPSLAAKIVAQRSEHGPFENVDALGDVPGIGEKLLAQIRPLVVVE